MFKTKVTKTADRNRVHIPSILKEDYPIGKEVIVTTEEELSEFIQEGVKKIIVKEELAR